MLAPDPGRPEFFFNIEWNVHGAYIDDHRAHDRRSPVCRGSSHRRHLQGKLNDDSYKDQSWTLKVAIPLAKFSRI